MEQNTKIMSLVKVLKKRCSRLKEKLKDIEILIDDKTASSRQQQEYIVTKAKIDSLEDIIDLAEGMIEE